MTDVRRALLWFAGLAALVLAGDRLFSWVLNRVLLRSQFRYSRLYRGGNDAEVIFLGDSRGVHSFYAPAVQELTGLRAFNLSYNSMSAQIAEAILLDYLDRNPPPRLVIIEITCVATHGELISELRTYVGLSSRLSALYSETRPEAAFAGRMFRLFALNSGFYLEALHYMRRSDQDWINHAVMPLQQRNAAAGEWWRMPLPENLAALSRMVRELRGRGIEVRLILAPYRPRPRNMNEFASVVAQTAGLPIWDYGSALSDPDSFADSIHLNEQGSRELLMKMKNDGVFAAKR
jgi:hypothetical protein